jgi:hypothetical protein
VVAERLDEDPGEGPGFTLWGDRWLAGSAMPTLDRALSAINTAVVVEVRKCFRMSDMAPRGGAWLAERLGPGVVG